MSWLLLMETAFVFAIALIPTTFLYSLRH